MTSDTTTAVQTIGAIATV